MLFLVDVPLQTKRSEWLIAGKTILISAAIWVLVAVPVAAGVSFLVVSVFIIYAFKDMAMTAAVIGASQGLCLFLTAKLSPPAPESSPERNAVSEWFGAAFGGALGLLGFVPVYSHTSISGGILPVFIFLLAAITGGALAGTVCRRRLTVSPLRPVELRRAFVLASLLLLILAAADYKVYWPKLDDEHPTPILVLSGLSAGDAKGAAWSGCYDSSGRFSDGSGSEGGRLLVRQQDGALDISYLDGTSYHGGVYRNGHLRAGGKTNDGGGTTRTFWTGIFEGDSFAFTKRETWVRNWTINTMKVAGTAKRVSCGS